MEAILLRTGSGRVHSSFIPGSPRALSLSVHDSVSGVFSAERSSAASPRISLHLELNRRRQSSIRRALSESDMTPLVSDAPAGFSRLSGAGSLSFPARIPEEEYVPDSDEVVVGGVGSLMLTERGYDGMNYSGGWPGSEISVEELGFPGGGIGNGRMPGGGNGRDDFGTGGFAGGSEDRSKIGEYYEEMLKTDPMNSLLLRNYGKFLHEVEGDAGKAEEYYGRAILANPGDGEVLSLYGKLIWESHRDGERAKLYFDQAVHASPNDSMVLGSYAQFMWEAEEDDEEEKVMEMEKEVEILAAGMIEVF